MDALPASRSCHNRAEGIEPSPSGVRLRDVCPDHQPFPDLPSSPPFLFLNTVYRDLELLVSRTAPIGHTAQSSGAGEGPESGVPLCIRCSLVNSAADVSRVPTIPGTRSGTS